MLVYKQLYIKGDPMSYKEYLDKEIHYIKWFQKYHKISIDEACQRWVTQGLAELYANKYWNNSVIIEEEVRA